MFEILRSLLADSHWLLLVVASVLAALFFYKGADLLVSGAVRFASHMPLSPLTIGITILGVGTCVPHLTFILVAVVQDMNDLALGTITGSVIIGGAIIPGAIGGLTQARPSPGISGRLRWTLYASCAGLTVVCWPWKTPLPPFGDGHLPRALGIAFLVAFFLDIWKTLRTARKHRDPMDELLVDLNVVPPSESTRASVPYTSRLPRRAVVWPFAGLAMVLLSATVLVAAFDVTGERLGVDRAVLGTTLVAFCLALPEIATAVVSAVRGYLDISIGNSLGSSISIVLCGTGTLILASPGGVSVGPEFFRHILPGMLLLLVVSVPAAYLRNWSARRVWAAVLGAAYAVFLWRVLS